MDVAPPTRVAQRRGRALYGHTGVRSCVLGLGVVPLLSRIPRRDGASLCLLTNHRLATKASILLSRVLSAMPEQNLSIVALYTRTVGKESDHPRKESDWLNMLIHTGRSVICILDSPCRLLYTTNSSIAAAVTSIDPTKEASPPREVLAGVVGGVLGGVLGAPVDGAATGAATAATVCKPAASAAT